MGRRLHEAALVAAAILALLLLPFIIVACGGGGVSSPPSTGPIIPAPKPRTDLLFGYYGGCATTALENGDHVNLHWATGWCGSGTWHLDVAQELTLARGAGVRNIVLALPVGMVWSAGATDEVRFQLGRLRQSGALAGWDSIMVYHTDEPDLDGRSDQDVTAVNGWLRALMAEIPELAGKPLGVFYACSSGARPGIATYDWIGCDDYNARCGVLEGAYGALRGALRPEQRLMVVAGGADPWRQDPACFATFVHRDPQVAALIGFIWQDNAARGVGAGIRSNGLRKFYCEAGRVIRFGSAAGC